MTRNAKDLDQNKQDQKKTTTPSAKSTQAAKGTRSNASTSTKGNSRMEEDEDATPARKGDKTSRR